jgi:hypothetical protein
MDFSWCDSARKKLRGTGVIEDPFHSLQKIIRLIGRGMEVARDLLLAMALQREDGRGAVLAEGLN